MTKLSDDELAWAAELADTPIPVLLYDGHAEVNRLVAADIAWSNMKPGGWDERSLKAVLRLGRRLRRALRLR